MCANLSYLLAVALGASAGFTTIALMIVGRGSGVRERDSDASATETGSFKR